MQLKLTFVKRTPKTSAAGKSYTSLSIKTNEYGDKWLSGFDGKETSSWKEGDTVEATVEEKGQYLNFSVPKASRGSFGGSTGLSEADLDKILGPMRQIYAEVRATHVEAEKTRVTLTDFFGKLIKQGIIKLEDVLPNVPFPTEDDLEQHFK